jgi:hypothetical protein
VPPNGVETYFASWHELVAGAEQLKPEYFSDGLYYVEAFMKYGCWQWSERIARRRKESPQSFATEFERTYTVFSISKSRSTDKEAQIEAALERVRNRTMAMHSSGCRQYCCNDV